MDPTDGTFDPSNIGSFATDFSAGGAVSSPEANPSNGIDLGGLMSQLIGTAGGAYVANQNAQAAQAIAASNAQAAALAAQPYNPLAIFSVGSGRTWLIVGAGILALALILRR